MNTLVIDASIAIKWVVEEDGTDLTLALRQKARLMAPDLMVAACANILWKVQRKELSNDEALIAARLLQSAEIELVPSRAPMESATRLAIELDHPAYDCLHLALRLRTVADLSLPMNVSSTRFGGIRKAHFMTVLWA